MYQNENVNQTERNNEVVKVLGICLAVGCFCYFLGTLCPTKAIARRILFANYYKLLSVNKIL